MKAPSGSKESSTSLYVFILLLLIYPVDPPCQPSRNPNSASGFSQGVPVKMENLFETGPGSASRTPESLVPPFDRMIRLRPLDDVALPNPVILCFTVPFWSWAKGRRDPLPNLRTPEIPPEPVRVSSILTEPDSVTLSVYHSPKPSGSVAVSIRQVREGLTRNSDRKERLFIFVIWISCLASTTRRDYQSHNPNTPYFLILYRGVGIFTGTRSAGRNGAFRKETGLSLRRRGSVRGVGLPEAAGSPIPSSSAGPETERIPHGTVSPSSPGERPD